MAAYSTAQVAKLIGIGRATLHRWMRKGKVPAPRTSRVAGVLVRLWTTEAVRRARQYKQKFYRKGRGRKPKRKR